LIGWASKSAVAFHAVTRQELIGPATRLLQYANLGGKPFRGAGFCFGGFFFAILRLRIGLEGTKEARGGLGDFVNGGGEWGLVGLRRLGESADFSDELERGVSNFFVRDGRIEIEKNFDVPAHCWHLYLDDVRNFHGKPTDQGFLHKRIMEA
jgi:hypothetical protein